jgi:hypothetical protein
MIIILRVAENKDSPKNNSLFDHNKNMVKHIFRISTNGLLIRKKNLFKFIPMNISEYYDDEIFLCKDEIGLALINLDKKGI